MGEIYSRKSKIEDIEQRYNQPIEELCYKLHHIEKKSLKEISEKFDIGQHTIGRWFKLLEIPVENRTQFKKGEQLRLGKKHSKKTIEEWHQTEQGRKEIFKKIGFDTLIIWENELDDTSLLIQTIGDWQDG